MIEYLVPDHDRSHTKTFEVALIKLPNVPAGKAGA